MGVGRAVPDKLVVPLALVAEGSTVFAIAAVEEGLDNAAVVSTVGAGGTLATAGVILFDGVAA